MSLNYKVKTYYSKNKKHTLQRDKFHNIHLSDRKYAKHSLSILNKNRRGLFYDIPKKMRDTLRKNRKSLFMISTNQYYFSNYLLQTNSAENKYIAKSLHSNLNSEPSNQSNNSSKKIQDTTTLFNYVHNIYPGYQILMMTLTVPNINLFDYPKFMKGKKMIGDSVHYNNNFPDLVRSMNRYLKRHFGIVGGMKNFETTINEEKMVAENPFGILHPHCHELLLVRSDLDVNEVKDAFFKEWSKLAKKHGMDVSDQAFDLENIYSKDDDTSFSKAIAEATKYVLKPNFYKHFPDEPTEFSADLFASLMSGNYGFKSSSKFGKVADAYSSINNSGSLKSAISVGMSGHPEYNFAGKSVFPDIVTKHAQFVYADGDKEDAHFKISKISSMSYREIIYYNKNLLENVLLNPNQIDWVRDCASSISSKYDDSCKKDGFDSFVNLMQNLPFYSSVDDFLDMINSVSEGYIDKGKDVAFKDYHAYRLWKARYDDLQNLIEAIRYYDDGNGYLNLAFHTNPNLRYKIFNWITAYKSFLDLSKYSWKRAWKCYALLHNSRNDVDKLFNDDEYQAFMTAMEDADDYFGKYDSVQPDEMACPDKPYCFVESSRGIALDILTQNTGEILTPSKYGKLTARANDDVNYDKDGNKWNINLFANISKSKEAEKIISRMAKPFVKRGK